jgi:DNA-binding Xre family transcriptional regulator
MTSYRESGDFEIIVECDDGYTFAYDDLDKTIRMLPADSNNMSEEMWHREFGRKLRKLMFRKGLTQIELANKVGISQATLSNYITGRNMPGFYIIDKLARALDCSTDDFRYI